MNFVVPSVFLANGESCGNKGERNENDAAILVEIVTPSKQARKDVHRQMEAEG